MASKKTSKTKMSFHYSGPGGMRNNVANSFLRRSQVSDVEEFDASYHGGVSSKIEIAAASSMAFASLEDTKQYQQQ